MARSKSSHRWLQEHVNDPYVKQAQKEGYRSRSSYKLIELDEKDRLIRPGMLVMDLGSAPRRTHRSAAGAERAPRPRAAVVAVAGRLPRAERLAHRPQAQDSEQGPRVCHS